MLPPVIHKCLITAAQESHCFTAVQQPQVTATSLAVVPYCMRYSHVMLAYLWHATAQGDVTILLVS